jgi:hypothetical protein
MKTPVKRQAKSQSPKASRGHTQQLHPIEHTIPSNDCALCRIKTLEAEAKKDTAFAGAALHAIAAEATRALERIRQTGNREVATRVAAEVTWPIIGSANSRKTQKLPAALGTSHPAVPFSTRKLVIHDKLPHAILFSIFHLIALLRDIQQSQLKRERRRGLPRIPSIRSFKALDQLVKKAPRQNFALFELIAERSVFQELPPELTTPTQKKSDLSKFLTDFAQSLGITDLIDATLFTRRFLVSASNLPSPSHDNAIDAWFRLGWVIILDMTKGNPASAETLQRLARGRELRKLNRAREREGEEKKVSQALANGDVNYRIYERLEAPLKTLKPGFRLRKNARGVSA